MHSLRSKKIYDVHQLDMPGPKIRAMKNKIGGCNEECLDL